MALIWTALVLVTTLAYDLTWLEPPAQDQLYCVSCERSGIMNKVDILRGPPVESAAAQAGDVGALRAGVARDAPQVLVESVGTGDLAVPLAALLSALFNRGSRSGRGDGAEHDSGSSEELHLAGE